MAPPRLLTTYDAAAGMIPYYMTMQRALGETIRRYAPDRSLLRVLELGYGTGITTQQILEDRRVALVAVDILDLERLARAKIGSSLRATFIREDCLSYLNRSPPGSFDIVASSGLIHNFWPGEKARVLRGIYRTLRQGGLFVNSDKYPRDDPAQHALDLEWELDRFSAAPDRWVFEAWKEHYFLDEHRLLRESDSIAQLRAIGFRDVRRTHRERMQALAVATKP